MHLLISGWFLLIAIGVWLALDGYRRYKLSLYVAAVLLFASLIFHNLLGIYAVVEYTPWHLSGIRVGFMPIEDFIYSLALAIMAPAIWNRVVERE